MFTQVLTLFQSLNKKIEEYETERLDCLQKLDIVDEAFWRGLYYEELSKRAANKRIEEANLKKGKSRHVSNLSTSTIIKKHRYMTYATRLRAIGQPVTAENIKDIWKPVIAADKARRQWEKLRGSPDISDIGYDDDLSKDDLKEVVSALWALGGKKRQIVKLYNMSQRFGEQDTGVRSLSSFWHIGVAKILNFSPGNFGGSGKVQLHARRIYT
jgi:hypothetical protein